MDSLVLDPALMGGARTFALNFDPSVPAGVVDIARRTLGDLAAVPHLRGGRSPLAKAIVSNLK